MCDFLVGQSLKKVQCQNFPLSHRKAITGFFQDFTLIQGELGADGMVIRINPQLEAMGLLKISIEDYSLSLLE